MRLGIAVIGFLSLLVAPPWVPVICIILLSLRYRAPEAIVLGLFLDFLWLPVASPLISFPLFTLAAVVIVWGFEPLRVEFLR